MNASEYVDKPLLLFRPIIQNNLCIWVSGGRRLHSRDLNLCSHPFPFPR